MTPTSASAHAILTNSFPAVNGEVPSIPAKVWLEFDGNLTQLVGKKINHIYLDDAQGKPISILKDYVGGARITAELKPSKITGRVRVSWRVVSEDGHPVTGQMFFYINPKSKGK